MVLPGDFPAWQTVYGYYRLWVRLGVWEQINAELVEQCESLPDVSAPQFGVDSQSVRIEVKGEETGFDGNKKVKGRKRHIVVDVGSRLLRQRRERCRC